MVLRNWVRRVAAALMLTAMSILPLILFSFPPLTAIDAVASQASPQLDVRYFIKKPDGGEYGALFAVENQKTYKLIADSYEDRKTAIFAQLYGKYKLIDQGDFVGNGSRNALLMRGASLLFLLWGRGASPLHALLVAIKLTSSRGRADGVSFPLRTM